MSNAIAHQIGNSQKERIELDGEVHLKSVNIGRWNYLVVLNCYNPASGKSCSFVGHSASRQAAEKWQPFPLRDEISLNPRYGAELAEQKAKVQEWRDRGVPFQIVRSRRSKWGGGWPEAVCQWDVQRKVIKIERGGK